MKCTKVFIIKLTKLLPIQVFKVNHQESIIITSKKHLVFVLFFLKHHVNAEFNLLTCISGVDYPDREERFEVVYELLSCLLYTSPSPRDGLLSRMPSSA